MPVPARVMPPLEITPEIVSEALFTVICRAAAFIFIAPDNVTAPVFVAAWPRIKIPPTLLALANALAVAPDAAKVPPFIVSVPVPNAVLFPARIVPVVSVTPPEKVLATLNVSALAALF